MNLNSINKNLLQFFQHYIDSSACLYGIDPDDSIEDDLKYIIYVKADPKNNPTPDKLLKDFPKVKYCEYGCDENINKDWVRMKFTVPYTDYRKMMMFSKLI